jgi:hypothetical protein
MKPNVLAGMSDAERAYFETGGAVDPTTGKPVEETDAGTDAEQHKQPDAGTGGEAESADRSADADAEGQAAEKAEGEEEGEDETVDVATGTDPDGKPKRKFIAFGAYEKERRQAKAAKEEATQLKQQLAYLTGLVQSGQITQQQGQQMAQAAQQPATTAPDPQKEPQKWLEWVNTTLAKVHQAETQQQRTAAQQAEIDRLNAAAYHAEQEFVNEGHADYYDALKFLEKSRRDELKMLGYDASTAQQILDAQNKDIAIRALQGQGNPAERFYALAKARGFKAPKPVVEKTEAEKVAEQAVKQKTNKSLAGLAGGETKNPLSLESLANTPTSELAKMLKEGKIDMWSLGQ